MEPHTNNPTKTPGILVSICSCASSGTVSNDLLGRSLAELFEEWRTITDQHNRNESDVMFSVYADVTHDLECRMVAAGVHSADDALAVIEWHFAVYPGSEYAWDFDALRGTSGALWSSMQGWLSEQPPAA